MVEKSYCIILWLYFSDPLRSWIVCVYIWKQSSAHALGASVVWHLSLPLMNRFNKAEAAIFPMQDMPSKKLNFKNNIWMSTKNRESSIQYIYIGRWVSNIDTNTAASSGRVWSYYHQLTVLWFAGMMTYAYITNKYIWYLDISLAYA